MMEYIAPSIEIIYLEVHDVIRTSGLEIGKETTSDSDTAGNMGF